MRIDHARTIGRDVSFAAPDFVSKDCMLLVHYLLVSGTFVSCWYGKTFSLQAWHAMLQFEAHGLNLEVCDGLFVYRW